MFPNTYRHTLRHVFVDHQFDEALAVLVVATLLLQYRLHRGSVCLSLVCPNLSMVEDYVYKCGSEAASEEIQSGLRR